MKTQLRVEKESSHAGDLGVKGLYSCSSTQTLQCSNIELKPVSTDILLRIHFYKIPAMWCRSKSFQRLYLLFTEHNSSVSLQTQRAAGRMFPSKHNSNEVAVTCCRNQDASQYTFELSSLE